jgi:MFS transporter, FSR family, fosmidomycin resistance protein
LLGSTRAAAWPLIRDDLALTYAEVGLVLAIPGFVGSALDPVIGVIGDTARRRALIVAGGLGFALSTALTAASTGFWTLLVALVIGNAATGAFVSLAQATLMDHEPARRERNMVQWTLAGSVGYAAGPILLAAALWLGLDWRGVIAAFAVAALPLALSARRLPRGATVAWQTTRESVRHALRALRDRGVVRWLMLLEAGDLLLDVFHAYLALYLVDVARVDAGAAALGVAVWTGAGLAGDSLLLWVLRHMSGGAYLRASAVATLAVYPAFLIVPGYPAKLALVALLGLLNAGWYAIPKAGLYASLPGRSGVAVAVGGIGGVVGACVPLALGLSAESFGLAPTLWTLLLAPVAVVALLPRR